jgi:hypothetical protein
MEASKANKEQVRFRMSDTDLEPIRKACEAADLSLSVVIRETLVRHGMAVAIQLAADRQFEAAAYAVTGKRLRRREIAPTRVTLVALVSQKFNVSLAVAEKWIKMGRIQVAGAVVDDINSLAELGDFDSVTKHAAS